MAEFIQGFFLAFVLLLSPFFLVTFFGFLYFRYVKHIEPIKRE